MLERLPPSVAPFAAKSVNDLVLLQTDPVSTFLVLSMSARIDNFQVLFVL